MSQPQLSGKFKVKAKDGKEYYSNASWLNEQTQHEMAKLVHQRTYCNRASFVVTSYLMLEAISRVKFFKKYSLYHRAAFVLVPGALAYFLCDFLYGKFTHNQMIDLLKRGNTPFWKNQRKVPELHKVFFELDDSNDFRPNILHHGLSEAQVKGFFPDFIVGSDESIKREFELIKSSPERTGHHHGIGFGHLNHAHGHDDHHGNEEHHDAHQKDHGKDKHHDKNHH